MQSSLSLCLLLCIPIKSNNQSFILNISTTVHSNYSHEKSPLLLLGLAFSKVISLLNKKYTH